MRHLNIGIAIAATVMCVCVSMPCSASLLDDAFSLVTDPFKLGQGSKNILESVTRIQQLMKDLDSLEIRTNADIAARLTDVKDITDRVIAAVDRSVAIAQDIEQDLVAQMDAIEKDIFNKAEALLEHVRCIVVDAETEFETALKNAALAIKGANPRITLLGIPLIRLDTREVRIADPWDGFLEVAKFHLTEIQKLTETSPAREFVHHYGEIARLAKRAQCAYRGQATAIWLEQWYIAPYMALENQWVTVVHPM